MQVLSMNSAAPLITSPAVGKIPAHLKMLPCLLMNMNLTPCEMVPAILLGAEPLAARGSV
jgi:hypothetical protein